MAIVMLDVILTLQCMVESDVMKGVLSGLFGLQVNKPDIQLPLIFFNTIKPIVNCPLERNHL